MITPNCSAELCYEVCSMPLWPCTLSQDCTAVAFLICACSGSASSKCQMCIQWPFWFLYVLHYRALLRGLLDWLLVSVAKVLICSQHHLNKEHVYKKNIICGYRDDIFFHQKARTISHPTPPSKGLSQGGFPLPPLTLKIGLFECHMHCIGLILRRLI